MNLPAVATSHALAFTGASLVLALIPGPAVVYLLTQTLSHGRRAGLASVGGVALGNLVNAAAALLGLAAILKASETAFTVVKLLGALYLVFLGLRALQARSTSPALVAAGKSAARHQSVFRDGVLVAAFNPKTTLFFAAFLPQFIDPTAASPLAQGLFLAAIFVAIALCTDTLYVLTASGLEGVIRRRPRWLPLGRYLGAATFVSLGVYAALSGPRPTR
jgi:threonine/homoserine/homoserine lactone efflux protein